MGERRTINEPYERERRWCSMSGGMRTRANKDERKQDSKQSAKMDRKDRNKKRSPMKCNRGCESEERARTDECGCREWREKTASTVGTLSKPERGVRTVRNCERKSECVERVKHKGQTSDQSANRRNDRDEENSPKILNEPAATRQSVSSEDRGDDERGSGCECGGGAARVEDANAEGTSGHSGDETRKCRVGVRGRDERGRCRRRAR